MSKYKMLILDIDGTLAEKDSTIPNNVILLLRKLMEHKIIVTLATGRMFSSAKIYADMIGIKAPLVTYNGAVVRRSQDRNAIFESLIPIETMFRVISVAEAYGYYIQLYNNETIIVNKRTQETDRDPDLKVVGCYEVGRLLEANIQESPKILTTMHPDDVYECRAIFNKEIPNSLHYTISGPGLLEILNKGISKAHSLDKLVRAMNINPSECIVCGDSNNDIEMVRWAGMGCAVSNATDVLKSNADLVLNNPRSKGIEELIYKFFGDIVNTKANRKLYVQGRFENCIDLLFLHRGKIVDICTINTESLKAGVKTFMCYSSKPYTINEYDKRKIREL